MDKSKVVKKKNINWGSAVVIIPKKMEFDEKNKKPKELKILTPTGQIATKNKKPAINIITTDGDEVVLDIKKQKKSDKLKKFGKEFKKHELTKWGSIDLKVPKEMAVYNAAGEEKLKKSLTKTDKLAKYENRPSVKFSTADYEIFESTGGQKSEKKISFSSLLHNYVWDITHNREMSPNISFLKRLKYNDKKVFTEEDLKKYNEEPTKKDKHRFKRVFITSLFEKIYPRQDMFWE